MSDESSAYLRLRRMEKEGRMMGGCSRRRLGFCCRLLSRPDSARRSSGLA